LFGEEVVDDAEESQTEVSSSSDELPHKQRTSYKTEAADHVKETQHEAISDSKSDMHHKQTTLPEVGGIFSQTANGVGLNPLERKTVPAAKAVGHTGNDGLAVDLYPPWDIKSIQEGLGGKYDRETIVDMLQKCRGDIDRAFAALLDDKIDVPLDKKAAPTIPVKPSLQASRSSSPFSTGSKRSAEDSDDSEDPRPARRTRPKKRLVSNLTLGVGISFRDERDEVVSLNLRVSRSPTLSFS
jgi:hypothetical protein